jgi:predicted membrane-bound spermidine synthase
MLDTGLKKADLIQWGCVTGFIGLAIAVVAVILLVHVIRKKT